MSVALEALSADALMRVTGGVNNPGYEPNNNALGRVGPGAAIPALGNYYTPEALQHDRAVRSNLAGGASQVMAHVKALPTFGAAAMSYFRARFNPGPQDMQLP